MWVSTTWKLDLFP